MEQPATRQACDKENATFRLIWFTNFWMDRDMSEIKVTYLAYGNETCPTTGKPHMQGFAYNATAQRASWWNKKMNPKEWKDDESKYVKWGRCNGNLLQNETYCSKQGSLIEFGQKPMGNGQKRSLAELCDVVADAAENSIPLCEIVTQPEARATYVQYHNGIDKIYRHTVNAKLRKIDRTFAPEVIYVFGPTGTGKSRYVHEKELELYKIPVSDKYKWKDGYYGQEAVLYDNVTPDNINPTDLLIEIDRYGGVQVPVKGGFSLWRPKRIYFTSVYSIEHFANAAKFSIPGEFIRRVTQVVDINEWLAQRAVEAATTPLPETAAAAAEGREAAV